MTATLVSGFCAERVWVFHLDRVSIRKRTIVITSTSLSIGAIIKDAEIFSPHATSPVWRETSFEKSSSGALGIFAMFAVCEYFSFSCRMTNSYSCIEHE